MMAPPLVVATRSPAEERYRSRRNAPPKLLRESVNVLSKWKVLQRIPFAGESV